MITDRVHLCLLCLTLMSAWHMASAQQVSCILDKKEYRSDESILVTFRAEIMADSIAPLDTVSFRILSGPNKSYSTQTINGATRSSSEVRYTLMPKRRGVMLLIVPDFFKNGEVYRGIPVGIHVSEVIMNAAERYAFDLDIFMNKGIKPKGSQRVTWHGELGYIQKFDGSMWLIERPLTKAEARKLGKSMGK